MTFLKLIRHHGSWSGSVWENVPMFPSKALEGVYESKVDDCVKLSLSQISIKTN